MQRTRFVEAIGTCLLGAMLLVRVADAAPADPPGALYDVPLPGGLHGAMRAVGDPAADDRGQFLPELIRRFYNAPVDTQGDRGKPLAALLAYLRASAAGSDHPAEAPTAETLPLPLPPAVWIAAVFGGQPPPQGLVSAILESRDAALLYYGLLSLDDDTRAWLAGRPDLVAEIASRHAAAFVLAAPALRVIAGRVRVPGGSDAEASWEALVQARVNDPPAFIRALLADGKTGLTHFFGAMAPLTPGQVRFALGLDAPAEGDRAATAQRLLAAFGRAAPGWKVRERTFWRPPVDPALLLADLSVNAAGHPNLPGTQEFWSLVFAGVAPHDGGDLSRLTEGKPVEFAWLCDEVFRAELAERRRRYHAVLFASRLSGTLSPASARDTVEAVRAAAEYPALAFALERVPIEDPAVFAAAARRAAQLSAIGDERRAVRTMTQFQGTLAILVRAASRLAFSPQQVSELVSSLSSVEPGGRGDYEGALVRWIETHLDARGAVALDDSLLALISGAAPATPALVNWEGTRYRVDLAHGEALRVRRLLGDERRPYLTSAAALVSIADALDEAGPLSQRSARQVALSEVAHAVGWDEPGVWPADVRERSVSVRASLEGGAAGGAKTEQGRTRALGVLADDLLARGLMDLAYAAALGQPDRAWVTAGDVARHHAFELPGQPSHGMAWELPALTTGRQTGIQVTGSLLGLDVALAEMSLVRLSLKPPPRKPMLADINRRALIEAAVLVGSAALSDGDRDRIAAAVRRGRERTRSVRTREEAVALAEELRLSPARAGLLGWEATRQPAAVVAFLSTGELFQLGLGDVTGDSPLQGWGAPAGSRLGCLCLRLPSREPWEVVAGRWGSGMLISTFPDLNLRLAELLSDMQMPASLLGPVLASATLDFVNTTISRDEDDRRGLVEYVNALDRERLEEYLALLTTDGPLVPIDGAPDAPVSDPRP